jgi:hypothetical protein
MPAQYHGLWINFFSQTASAAATLVGLVIVAVSVNIKRILGSDHLPSRAAATIAMLVLVLVTSTSALIPGQSTRGFGCEAAFYAILCWGLQIRSGSKTMANKANLRKASYALVSTVIGHVQAIPFVIGGLLLLLGSVSGFYWLAAGVVTTFVFSMINTWVLLIEILR